MITLAVGIGMYLITKDCTKKDIDVLPFVLSVIFDFILIGKIIAKF